MTVIVNGGVSGDLNPGFGGGRAPVATAIAIVRQPSLTTSLGDAFSAQVSYGWDQVSGAAHIVLPQPNGAVDDSIVVTMGAASPQVRFHGTLREFDTTLFPHAVTAMAKGPLSALEEYRTDVESTENAFKKPGMDLGDLVGSSSATLKQITSALLTLVGVSFSSANLDDPSHVYGFGSLGTLSLNTALLWGSHETAASYLHRFLEASAGYRLFDSSDGNVYLKQISAIPVGTDPLGRADLTFTLGKDIFGDSAAVSSSIGRQLAVLVEGWDNGLGPATSGLIGTGASAFRVSSNLIETNAFATEIANFWLPQVSRLQRVVRLTTPRDDLIGPGQTVFIDAAGGLGVSDTMWVKSVTAEVATNGEFTQHLVCVAAAT